MVERGRFVSLDLSGKLGKAKTVPSLSDLARLRHLDVSGNVLTHLDRGDLGRLGTLDCRENRIVSIDLTGCGGLESLDLRRNRLVKLDLSPLVCANEVRLTKNPLRSVVASEVLIYGLRSVRKLGKKLRVRKNTPAELHSSANAYNWDDSDAKRDLGWVAENEACDRATALLIFWRAQPAHFYGLSRRDLEADRAKMRTLAFLRSIEKRFATGFYENATICYDPGGRFEGGASSFRDPRVPACMRVRARAKPS